MNRELLQRGSRLVSPRRALILATALVLAAGMFYYYHRVLIPIWRQESATIDSGTGNWSDLYPRWLGARELLWHHRNPYSPDVTREIQRGFYGRPLEQTRDRGPDPEAFAYPVYVVFVLAPSLRFPFDAVRNFYNALMLLLTAASIPLWMRAFRISLELPAAVLAWIAILSSYPTIDGFHLEQLTLLVAVLISASVAALAEGRLALSGILLALATIKPQLTIFVAAGFLLWTIGDWGSRKWFAIGFGGTMAAQLIGAELVLPGWFGFWRKATTEYLGYHRPPLLTSLLGQPAATLVGAAGVLFCGIKFWRSRGYPPGSGQFNFALVSVLVLTELLVPNAGGGAYYNQLLLLPAALWLFTTGTKLAKEKAVARLAWIIAVVMLAGQWVTALIVSCNDLILHHHFQSDASLFVGAPELLVYEFPVALALFVMSAATRATRLETS